MFKKGLYFLAGLLFLRSATGLALPCCGVEGPRVLASLQELRRLDFSFSTSFQEVYAKYDSNGKVNTAQGDSDLAFQVITVARLAPDVELFGSLPLIYRRSEALFGQLNQAHLGNIQLGLRRTLLRNLYLEDALPNISVIGAVKIPTGLADLSLNPEQVGWEPYLGLGVQKEFLSWSGNVDFGLAVRQRELFLKAAESVSYLVFHPLTLGAGAQQMISLNGQNNVVGLLSFMNWSLGQFTLLGVQVDWSLPVRGLGVNQPLTRSASLSLRYTFY